MGTPALTSRGFGEADFVRVADLFDRAVGIAVRLKATERGKKLRGFREMCAEMGPAVDLDLVALRSEVCEFAEGFPTVGFTEDEMAFKGDYNVDIEAA